MNAGIPTPEERAENHRALAKMAVGNRFRLMFGMPLLPEVRRLDAKGAEGLIYRVHQIAEGNLPEVGKRVLMLQCYFAREWIPVRLQPFPDPDYIQDNERYVKDDDGLYIKIREFWCWCELPPESPECLEAEGGKG